MHFFKFTAISALCINFVFIHSVKAENTPISEEIKSINEEIKSAVINNDDQRDFLLTPTNIALKSAEGGTSATVGVRASGEIPTSQKLKLSLLTPNSSCYATWWVSGSHNWKWKSYFFYLQVSLNASSSAFYGNNSGPCTNELILDKLETIGQTIAWADSNTAKATINKTSYNVSTDSASGSDKAYGYNLTSGPCGASTLHRATKNGVTWNTIVSSGCAGAIGTY